MRKKNRHNFTKLFEIYKTFYELKKGSQKWSLFDRVRPKLWLTLNFEIIEKWECQILWIFLIESAGFSRNLCILQKNYSNPPVSGLLFEFYKNLQWSEGLWLSILGDNYIEKSFFIHPKPDFGGKNWNL